MSMEKYYKEINFIAFLKLFRTEKSVKKEEQWGNLSLRNGMSKPVRQKNKILKDYIKYFSQ